LNKNAVYKIIQTSRETINKTISHVAAWSTFNWNFDTVSLINANETPIIANTEINVSTNREFSVLAYSLQFHKK